MEELVELRKVLVSAESYSWESSLFLPDSMNWEIDSLCAVLNMDDLADDEEVPEFAVKNRLIYVLSIQEIQDIVRNAYSQRSNCVDKNLFEAFLYYYKNDAFIQFE